MKKPRKNQQKRKIIGAATGVVMGILACPAIVVLAWDDAAKKAFYSENKDYFIQNSLFKDIVRTLGWWLVQGLKFLTDACEDLYDAAFSLIDFTKWGELGSFIDSMEPVFIAIMCLSLFILGIILIVDHKKKPKLLTNALLAMFIVCGLTVAMERVNTLVQLGKDAILGEGEHLSNEVIADGVWDLIYIANTYDIYEFHASEALDMTLPALTDDEVALIDPAQKVNYKTSLLKNGGEDVFKYRLTYVYGEEGQIEEVYNGFGWNSADDTDWFNEFYYRYKVDYFTIYMTLIVLIIVYFCLAYKVARLCFELVTSRVLAVLYSADLTGGQKTAKILTSIRDTYITLLFTALLLRLFMIGRNAINTTFQDRPVVKALLLLFFALTVMDGPNIMEKLTGVDAGLKSGWGKIVGGIYAARAAKGAVSGGVHAAKGAFGGGGRHGLSGFGSGGGEKGKGSPEMSGHGQRDKDMKNMASDVGKGGKGKTDPQGAGVGGQGDDGTGSPAGGSTGSGQQDMEKMRQDLAAESSGAQGVNDGGTGSPAGGGVGDSAAAGTELENPSDTGNAAGMEESSMDNGTMQDLNGYNPLTGKDSAGTKNSMEQMKQDLSKKDSGRNLGASGIQQRQNQFTGNLGGRNRKNQSGTLSGQNQSGPLGGRNRQNQAGTFGGQNQSNVFSGQRTSGTTISVHGHEVSVKSERQERQEERINRNVNLKGDK